MFDCLIIIPAYNEEKNIGGVIKEIRDLNLNVDILVVNDGSGDKTMEVARNLECRVISHPFNMGYGAALQTGFKFAVQNSYKYSIQFDADGQHDPHDINTIYEKLKKEDIDIVIGSRFLGRGAFKTGWLKKIAIGLFRFLIKIFTGNKITDPTSGLQGLSKCTFTYYSQMGHFPGDFPDADILIYMLKSKFTVAEFPANIRARKGGVSMHSGIKPIIYFLKILLSIMVVLLRPKISKEICEV